MNSGDRLSVERERMRFDHSFSPAVCRRKALVAFARFLALSHFRPRVSIIALLKTHRQLLRARSYDSPFPWFHRVVESCIGKEFSKGGRANFLLWSQIDADEDDFRFLSERGGIVLKRPRIVGQHVVEKGVLLLTYSPKFRPFCSFVEMSAFLRDYVLILEPSWSAYAHRNILYFTRFADHPIIVLAPEKGDYQLIKSLRGNLIPMRLGCSDWVNPSIFRPLQNQAKRYDAAMVARWALHKRHHVLLRALQELRDSSFRVALVGGTQRSSRREIEALIDTYGVADNISIFEALSQEELNEVLNQSKVNLLLSLQEGGNRSLFEGFFAGVPGLALKNNTGLPKDYFTPQTGKLIDEKNLASELLYFREHWSDFDPRTWAMANISPEATTAKLNELLRDLAYQRGEEWTVDLVAKCNSPHPEYYPDKSIGEKLPTMKDLMTHYARSEEIRNLLGMETNCRQQ